MQARLQDEWRPIYYFDLQEQFLVDYEVTNWYLSNHPQSHFLTGLIAARSFEAGRYALSNNNFAIHLLGGETERKRLTSARQLRQVLEGPFGLRLPDVPALDHRLAQLTKTG